MPDLTPLRTYENALTQAEEALTAALQARYEALRLRLADVLRRRGLGELLAVMRSELSTARGELRTLLRSAIADAQAQAVAYGQEELARLAQLLGAPVPTVTPPTAAISEFANAEANRGMLWFDQASGLLLAQAAAMNATTTAPAIADERLFAADAERASVWVAGLAGLALASSETTWAVANGSRLLLYQRVAQQQPEREYRKQALATIDARTTNCCLRVHGQIRDMRQPFDLEGTPRYAAQMDWAPFHYNCRTSVTLYHERMESVGARTTELVAAAQDELRARQQDTTTQRRRSQTARGNRER